MISKKFRLLRWRVKKIMKTEKSERIGYFIVKKLPNKAEYHRYGLVLSRKLSKLATTRNQKRRQIYEAIREVTRELSEMKDGKRDTYYDIVLIPFKQILTCNYKQIHQNVYDILTRI